MAKTRKKATGKKKGAQPGNKNALRHGFYSKQFTAEETKRLDGQETTDVGAEINLLRVCMDQLFNQIYFEPAYLKNKDGARSDIRDDHYLKQLNTLALMTQSLGGLVRTNHLIKGKGGSVNDAILQALEELRLELGI